MKLRTASLIVSALNLSVISLWKHQVSSKCTGVPVISQGPPAPDPLWPAGETRTSLPWQLAWQEVPSAESSTPALCGHWPPAPLQAASQGLPGAAPPHRRLPTASQPITALQVQFSATRWASAASLQRGLDARFVCSFLPCSASVLGVVAVPATCCCCILRVLLL